MQANQQHLLPCGFHQGKEKKHNIECHVRYESNAIELSEQKAEILINGATGGLIRWGKGDGHKQHDGAEGKQQVKQDLPQLLLMTPLVLKKPQEIRIGCGGLNPRKTSHHLITIVCCSRDAEPRKKLQASFVLSVVSFWAPHPWSW